MKALAALLILAAPAGAFPGESGAEIASLERGADPDRPDRLDPIVRRPRGEDEAPKSSEEGSQDGSADSRETPHRDGSSREGMEPSSPTVEPSGPSAWDGESAQTRTRRGSGESRAIHRRDSSGSPRGDEAGSGRFEGVAREPLKPEGGQTMVKGEAAAPDPEEYQDLGSERIRRLLDRAAARPEEPGRWIALGNAYAGKKRLEAAERAYRRALGLDSGSSVAWNNLCGIRLQEYRDEEALEACESAVRSDPYNAWAHYNTGIALDRLDRIPEALDSYQRALSLDTSLRNARFNPNIVNNEYLQILKLRLYRDEGGALTLPLQSAPPGDAR